MGERTGAEIVDGRPDEAKEPALGRRPGGAQVAERPVADAGQHTPPSGTPPPGVPEPAPSPDPAPSPQPPPGTPDPGPAADDDHPLEADYPDADDPG